MISLDNFQLPTRTYKGNALLIAGPGSGKTRTVAAKIEYEHEIEKEPLPNLKMLTFSRRAAGELLKRLPYLEYRVHVHTIHQFGLSILRNNGHNYKVFGSTPDSNGPDPRQKIMLQFFSEDSSPRQLREVHRQVSDVLAAIDRYKSSTDRELAEIYKPSYEFYQSYLKKNNLIDFNDMLSIAIEVIEKHPFHVKWLFLDEGHDTNMLQYELFKRIKADYVWAVFDPHQMIYRWNGADERNIQRFKKDFHPKEFKLLNDWRSIPEIVNLLEKIYPRGLIAKGEGKGGVNTIECSTESQLGIARSLCQGSEDHLILARTNYQLTDNRGTESGDIILDFSGNKNKLITIHKSKGTEADTIVLLGCQPRYIPFYRSTDEEEEKNLFYVACARAKNNLFLLYDMHLTPFLEKGGDVWLKT